MCPVSARDYCESKCKKMGWRTEFFGQSIVIFLSAEVAGKSYATHRNSWEELASAIGVLLDMERFSEESEVAQYRGEAQ